MTSRLEVALALQLRALKIEFVSEHAFCPGRRWRFDFAIPELMIAIECEGGIYTDGAHTRGKHYESDIEKYNAATILGWKILRFSGDMIKNGYAIRVIERAIAEVRALHAAFRAVSVPLFVLSPAVSDIPNFEKSSRRAITALAAKRGGTVLSGNAQRPKRIRKTKK